MGKKLTEQTLVTTINDSDLIAVVSNPGTVPASGKAEVDTLFAKRNLTNNDAWTAKGDLVVGTDTDTASILNVGADDKLLVADSSETTGLKWVDNQFGLNLAFGNGVSEIAADSQMVIEMPFAGTIESIRMLADTSGSMVIDLWKDVYANYPPTNADSMVGGATKPNITSASKSEMTSFSGWSTVAFAKGDILIVNVDSCTDIMKVTVAIAGKKTF